MAPVVEISPPFPAFMANVQVHKTSNTRESEKGRKDQDGENITRTGNCIAAITTFEWVNQLSITHFPSDNNSQ